MKIKKFIQFIKESFDAQKDKKTIKIKGWETY